ncbi:MAG: prepilin-type N-terminal cleavage/methylation domain-containing protein [Myxococcales bacterium]|nr:prepilin-type N-terminal cleavage/methylation domain-containing protein [Myxococcales bacterium]
MNRKPTFTWGIRGGIDHARALAGDRGGFTLIEIMLAVLILSVGMMAMAALQWTVVRSNAQAEGMGDATVVAEQGMEIVKMTPYANITSGNFPAEDYGTILGHPLVGRATTIQNDTPGTDRKTITVTGTYRDRTGAEHSVSLTSIIRDNS